MEKEASVESDDSEVQESLEEEDAPEEQQYSIPTGRAKRQIKPPQRVGYADLVYYASNKNT